MDNLVEKTVKKNLIYDGRILQLYNDEVSLPDGRKAHREYVNHSGGCAVLAVDGEENVWLVEQYRYPYDEVLFEIPAGKRNQGEDPCACAVRELEEECGLRADNVEKLIEVYPTVAYSNEHIYVYLAKGLHPVRQHLDEGEFLNAVKVPFAQALDMVLDGRIKDSKTVAAILKYKVAYLGNK